MTAKMKSFVKGILAGLVGKPLEFAPKKEPVTYLYNGVRMPALPNWDKTAYPYAAIASLNGNAEGTVALPAQLILSSVPLYANTSVLAFGILCGSANGSALRYEWGDCYLDNGNVVFVYEPGFVYQETETFKEGGSVPYTNGFDIVWANHNIYKKTDTTALYLEASEPVLFTE